MRKGYPVTSVFARQVTQPERRSPTRSSPRTTSFIGPTFPDHIVGLGTTLTLWDRLSIDMLGEFQTGGYNINFVGYQNANRGNWRPCYDAQRKIVAAQQQAMRRRSAASTRWIALDARWTARSSVRRLRGSKPIDFFRLRYATVSYGFRPASLRGMQNATLTLARAGTCSTSSDYSGLDPESADAVRQQVGRREYYMLPQLRSFSLALMRVGW